VRSALLSAAAALVFAAAAVLVVLAFVPGPADEAFANPATTPNPSKQGWMSELLAILPIWQFVLLRTLVLVAVPAAIALLLVERVLRRRGASRAVAVIAVSLIGAAIAVVCSQVISREAALDGAFRVGAYYRAISLGSPPSLAVLVTLGSALAFIPAGMVLLARRTRLVAGLASSRRWLSPRLRGSGGPIRFTSGCGRPCASEGCCAGGSWHAMAHRRILPHLPERSVFVKKVLTFAMVFFVALPSHTEAKKRKNTPLAVLRMLAKSGALEKDDLAALFSLRREFRACIQAVREGEQPKGSCRAKRVEEVKAEIALFDKALPKVESEKLKETVEAAAAKLRGRLAKLEAKTGSSTPARRPLVLGGACSYRDIPGTATIVSLGATVKFNFEPADPNAPSNVAKSPFKNEGASLILRNGQPPPVSCQESQGLTVGSKHEAVRSEIVKGACTPVIFRFTKLDEAACQKSP
jgi:hypothetical protein